jgi:hypothetical protein
LILKVCRRGVAEALLILKVCRRGVAEALLILKVCRRGVAEALLILKASRRGVAEGWEMVGMLQLQMSVCRETSVLEGFNLPV